VKTAGELEKAEFKIQDLIYENPLACHVDIQGFRLEGDAAITFPRGRMRMKNAYERDEEKHRHVAPSYRLEVIKFDQHLLLSMNNVVLFHWIDDGRNFDPVLKNGKIGFRQMAGLIAEYANLQVHEVVPLKGAAR